MSYFARSKHGFAVFAVGAVLAACANSPEVQAAAVDQSIYRLLPADTVAVFGADMKSARLSPFYERFVRTSHAGDLDEWARETGFDPREDLDNVIGGLYTEGDETAGLMVIRGRFADAMGSSKFEETMQAAGSHRGVTIYQRGEGDDGFAFISDRLAVLGDRGRVMNAIERHFAGGDSLADNAELSGRATDAQASGQFWMVASNAGQVLEALPSGGDQRQARIVEILAGMSEMSVTADVVRGFELAFAGACDTPENARTLAEAAKGMLALARISLPAEEQDLLKVLDRVSVRDLGQTFEAEVALDSLQVEELMEHFDNRETAGN